MNNNFFRMLLFLIVLAITACSSTPSYPGISTVHTGWQVQVFQDDREIAGRGGQFRLEKHPFELQVSFPAGSALMINTLDKDSNFNLDLDIPCEEKLNPFCPGMGVAEGNDPNRNIFLVIDPLGSHYLDETTAGRWWSLQDNGDELTGRKMVRTLMFPIGMAPFPQTPIEEFTGDRLYLIFYLEMDGDWKVSENEIWKIILNFK